jgi:hypothetical protein
MKIRIGIRKFTETRATPPLVEGDASRESGTKDLADPLNEEDLDFAFVGVKTTALALRALSPELLREF